MKKLRFVLFLMLFVTLVCCIFNACNDDGEDDTTEPDAPDVYTVTFDSDGGTAVDAQEVEDGKKATKPPAPTKAGYTFDGWFVGDDEWNFIGYTVTDDMTLKAKWNINTYSITYLGIENAWHSNPASYTVETDTIHLHSPVRNGYTFEGWFDKNDCLITDIATNKVRNIALTAKWSVYTVTTNTNFNGGSFTNYTDKSVTAGNTVTLTATTHPGYTFIGWFEGDKKVSDSSTFSFEMEKENVVYTVKWGGAYIPPCYGGVQKIYSPDEAIYDKTMNDFRKHFGVDISGNLGDDVCTIANGVIESIEDSAFMGKTVVINHGNGLKSYYMNLGNTLPSDIQVGGQVMQGTVIGCIGNSAISEISDTPHLHFEITLNGERVDPSNYTPFY